MITGSLKIKTLLFILIFATTQIDAGNDLTTALKALDSGDKARAVKILKQLQRKDADSPETLLLDALLNENAEEAKAVYEFIYEEYPDFKYADLCLFRLYSYNYAIGNYITAAKYLQKLKTEFPDSPYAKAEKDLPKPVYATETHGQKPKDKTSYVIQVGAFSNPENARKLAEKFKRKGYRANVASKIVGSAIFNVVTVGEYSSRAKAEKHAGKIGKEFGIKTRIIKSKR